MIIIHDARLPEEYRRGLEENLPQVELLPFGGINDHGKPRVYESILCHPDIYFFQIDEKTLIHAPGVPEDFLKTLRENDIELIKGEEDPHGRYPYTVRYNSVRVGGIIFHNKSYTDPVIIDAARERGLESIDVPQGYTRCSVIPVNDRALITSDNGIAEAARNRGIDVLLVWAGSVVLPGEKYGFIGGCSGKDPEGNIILLGSMRSHPEESEMNDFLRKNGVSFASAGGADLYDAGGLLVFS